MAVAPLFVLAAILTAGAVPDSQDQSGRWAGGTNATGRWRFIEVHLRRDGAALSGTADVAAEQAAGLALEDLRLEDGRLSFRVSTPRGAFRFSGTLRDDVIEGTVSGGAPAATLHLMRLAEPPTAQADAAVGSYRLDQDQELALSYRPHGQLLGLLLERSGRLLRRAFVALPAGPDRYVTSGSVLEQLRRNEILTLRRDPQGGVTGITWEVPGGTPREGRRMEGFRQAAVRFAGPAGPIAGTITFPAGSGPFPGVVIVAGSGPTGRDNAFIRAREFAGMGLAALAVDKRGVGETAGDYFGSSLPEYAADAAAALDYLRSRPDIRADRTGMTGHSQGAWVAPLAAGLVTRPPAWMVITSGGPTAPAEQEAWRAGFQTRAAGGDTVAVRDAVEMMRRKWRYAFTGEDWPGYSAAAQAAVGRPWAGIVALTLVPDPWAWAFARALRDFDPMTSASALTMPVLVVFGDRDDEQPVDLTRANWEEAFRRGGHADHAFVTLPGLGHSLWLGTGSPVPLLDAPTEAIRGWLQARLR